ncbi:hypothetical protein [Burkholderia gladioli]|uniref:hypothetical protein n=1 Tax=Burkholderia gladioli TaxID=28095 RepID=UPI000F526A2B|nr:hypothetical protein [Burkholderia gladioli]
MSDKLSDCQAAVEILKAQQQHIAADRFMCDPECELPQWDALQRVIDMLGALAASPEQAISESEWLPIETAPKDGSEVALLFAREFELSGRMYSRVRAASWIGDWSIPYSRLNPPIGWNPMPAAPVDAARKGEKS